MHRIGPSLVVVAVVFMVLPLGQRDRRAGYNPTLELPIREMMGLGSDFELGVGNPLRTEAEVLDGLSPGNRSWRREHEYRVVHGRVHDHSPKQSGVVRLVDPYLGPGGEAPIFWLVVLHSWRPGPCVAHPASEEHIGAYPGPHEAPMEYTALIPDATGRTAVAMMRCLRNKLP